MRIAHNRSKEKEILVTIIVGNPLVIVGFLFLLCKGNGFMKDNILTLEMIDDYKNYLVKEEKSEATIEKYLRDVRCFYEYAKGQPLTKAVVIEYKQHIIETGYAIRSVNSMLASVNSLLRWMNLVDCKVKNLRLQPKVYCEDEQELTKQEYLRLVKASGNNLKITTLLQTICGTGIRISELKYFTAEAVEKGEVTVFCKNKMRTILIPGKLRKLLKLYMKKNHIKNYRTLRRMQMQIWNFSVLSVNLILRECQSTMRHLKKKEIRKSFQSLIQR